MSCWSLQEAIATMCKQAHTVAGSKMLHHHIHLNQAFLATILSRSLSINKKSLAPDTTKPLLCPLASFPWKEQYPTEKSGGEPENG